MQAEMFTKVGPARLGGQFSLWRFEMKMAMEVKSR